MNKLREELNLKIWHCCANYEDLPDNPSGNKSAKKLIKNLEDWINKNYISKEEILGLEELKEEDQCPNELRDTCGDCFKIRIRNQVRLEIKEEIKKL